MTGTEAGAGTGTKSGPKGDTPAGVENGAPADTRSAAAAPAVVRGLRRVAAWVAGLATLFVSVAVAITIGPADIGVVDV